MISKDWHANKEEIIFVDRSRNIFEQVLHYLRDGNVVLPESIPTDMFTRELDYYGVAYDRETITDGNAYVAAFKERIAAQDKIRDIDRRLIAQMEEKIDVDRRLIAQLEENNRELEDCLLRIADRIVEIVVETQTGEMVRYRIKLSSPLSKLFENVASRYGVNENKLQFSFRGRVLTNNREVDLLSAGLFHGDSLEVRVIEEVGDGGRGARDKPDTDDAGSERDEKEMKHSLSSR